MKFNVVFRRCVVSLSLLGMLTCQLAQAAVPATGQTGGVRDVALAGAQVLAGQLVTSQGAPQSNVDVALLQDDRTIATTRTDADGRFAFSGVAAGVYQLQTPTSSGVYRVWAPHTAPPAAAEGVLLVAGQDVVRQQAPLLSHLANPWVLAAIVAAAIAIPLALDDDDAS